MIVNCSFRLSSGLKLFHVNCKKEDKLIPWQKIIIYGGGTVPYGCLLALIEASSCGPHRNNRGSPYVGKFIWKHKYDEEKICYFAIFLFSCYGRKT